ncbi:MAG: IS66 family insertion sequence element accessory protein TnpB [Gammaproteobacteria bacterium]|nr:IS66 family insertion sequence element accessory protein TnpB [Gammaproteobacteria bacterium]
MLPLPNGKKVYLYRHAVDMRKSFDGLAAVTLQQLGENPLSGDLFVFLNRTRTIIKILFWDESGYCLVAKRLEKGSFEQPLQGESNTPLKLVDLHLILEGVKLSGIRYRSRFKLSK